MTVELALLSFSSRDERVVYWSKAALGAPPFQSAPAVLIQGIYERRPEVARKILRERIYTTAPMSETLHALIKVCAKRVDAGVSIVEIERRISAEALELTPLLPPAEVPAPPAGAPMDQARWLAKIVSRDNKPLYLRDRAIGAVLVSKDGTVLGRAVNTNALNRFCHAEINLLRQLRAPIPAGASLYVTLKPCRMCAAMILAYCDDAASLRVFYDEDDPGPNARRTALDLFPQPIQAHYSLTDAPPTAESRHKQKPSA